MVKHNGSKGMPHYFDTTSTPVLDRGRSHGMF